MHAHFKSRGEHRIVEVEDDLAAINLKVLRNQLAEMDMPVDGAILLVPNDEA